MPVELPTQLYRRAYSEDSRKAVEYAGNDRWIKYRRDVRGGMRKAHKHGRTDGRNSSYYFLNNCFPPNIAGGQPFDHPAPAVNAPANSNIPFPLPFAGNGPRKCAVGERVVVLRDCPHRGQIGTVWHALNYEPRHYATLQWRLRSLVVSGIVLKIGTTCGTKYQLTEGW